MTIEQRDVVDFLGVEKDTGKVILSMVDHLDWDDIESHLLVLQEKLNTYIAFWESGEIFETFPDSKGRDPVIAILTVFPLSPDARVAKFISELRDVLGSIGLELRVGQLPQEEPS